uniref:Uncharacterized protein n=1 Tax=Glossina pallidipes TaxID=7398 RepID=A0A1B0A1G8_GLOPL
MCQRHRIPTEMRIFNALRYVRSIHSERNATKYSFSNGCSRLNFKWPITKYVHKLFTPFVKFKIDYLRFIWIGSSHQIFTTIRLPKSLHFKLSQLQFCVQHVQLRARRRFLVFIGLEPPVLALKSTTERSLKHQTPLHT